MKTVDWDDPEIRAIGRRWAADAYDIATELDDYGADAASLVEAKRYLRERPRTLSLPTEMVDVLAGDLTRAATAEGSSRCAARRECHAAYRTPQPVGGPVCEAARGCLRGPGRRSDVIITAYFDESDTVQRRAAVCHGWLRRRGAAEGRNLTSASGTSNSTSAVSSGRVPAHHRDGQFSSRPRLDPLRSALRSLNRRRPQSQPFEPHAPPAAKADKRARR